MNKCRICNFKLKEIVNLGKIALVGNFTKNNKIQKKYNISLNYCIKCKHVQSNLIPLNQKVEGFYHLFVQRL